MSGFKTEKMVSVSVAGEKQGHSGDDNTVSHFTNPSPSCISMILSMRLHLVDFIGSLDYLYVDYLLVFYIFSCNSDSWVDIHTVRETFDIGKNLLAAIVFQHRGCLETFGVFVNGFHS